MAKNYYLEGKRIDIPENNFVTSILCNRVFEELTNPYGKYNYNIDQRMQNKIITHLFKPLDRLGHECISRYIKPMVDQITKNIFDKGSNLNLIRKNFTIKEECLQLIANTVLKEYGDKWSNYTAQTRLSEEMEEHQHTLLNLNYLKQEVFNRDNKDYIDALTRLVELASKIADKRIKLEVVNVFEKVSEEMFSKGYNNKYGYHLMLMLKKLYTQLSYPGKLQTLIKVKEPYESLNLGEGEEKAEELQQDLDEKRGEEAAVEGLYTINFAVVIKKIGLTLPQNLLIIEVLKDKGILPTIKNLAQNGEWSNYSIIMGDRGVVGFLEESYLEKQLVKLLKGKTKNEQVDIIQTALGLGFEQINISIMEMKMKSDVPNLTCSLLFTQKYPRLVEEWIQSHPEFFVDPFIARCVLDDKNYLSVINEDIAPSSKHTAICEALKPSVLKQYSNFNQKPFSEFFKILQNPIKILELEFESLNKLEKEFAKQTSDKKYITNIIGGNLSKIYNILQMVKEILLSEVNSSQEPIILGHVQEEYDDFSD